MERPKRLTVETLESRALLSGVPAAWQSLGAGGGGALFAPQISPHAPSDIFVASDMGQLFHTTTAGVSWETVDFHEIQASPVTQVQFTNLPSTLYALDATSIDGGDTVRVTKSVDGGRTWDVLPGDPLGGEPAYKLFVDPADYRRLIISDYNSLWFSNNAGASFTQKFSTTSSNGLHLAGALFNGTNIFVGTSSGLLVSTDAGQTFTVSTVGGIGAGEAILSLAGAKQGTTTRFFAITRPASDVYAGIGGADAATAKLYTLDWGQASWTPRTPPSGVSPFFVGMAQNNTGVAYLSGGGSAGAPTVYKTTNGGATWQSVFVTNLNQNIATGWAGHSGEVGWTWNETALGFTVATNDANRLVITDYGFAHASSDGGATWRQLYVNPADENPMGQAIPKGQTYRSSGLDNTTSWGITWTSPDKMIVSSTDIRGTQSNDGGDSFNFDYTGHSRNTMYWSTVQPATGVVYAATSSVHDLYQSTYLTDARIDGGNGAVLYSTDQGHTWLTMHDFGHPVVWVATDPTNSGRLYASVVHSTLGGIYVSNDAGRGASSTWTRLATPPRTEGHPNDIRVLGDGTLVVSYSGRRTTAFTASSGVFVSSDGGQTWSDRSAAGMRYWTKDVVIDPFDASQNTWYAGVFSGWGGPPNGLGGLYKTTNRGVSWTRILNLDRVESATINPTDTNEMFITTETEGLWHTSNLRAATPTFTQVTSYPFRQPERVFFNPYDASEIWVTSFGGGLRRGTVAAPVTIGDMNGDGVVDNFDIQPLELALTNPGAYLAQYPSLTDFRTRGDINHSGALDNFDVGPFEDLLTGLAQAQAADAAALSSAALSDVALSTAAPSSPESSPSSASAMETSIATTPGSDSSRDSSQDRSLLRKWGPLRRKALALPLAASPRPAEVGVGSARLWARSGGRF